MEQENRTKIIYSTINCVVLWILVLVLTVFIIPNQLIILFDNPFLPFDKMKQILIILTIVMFQTANFKTDMREEKRNNLIRFKFLHYIMVNDNVYHKLNYNNYKIFKLIVITIIMNLSNITNTCVPTTIAHSVTKPSALHSTINVLVIRT